MGDRYWPRALFAVLGCGVGCGAAGAAETRFGAKMFLDTTVVRESGPDAAPRKVGVDVTRFYLQLDHDLDAVWSLHLTTDFDASGDADGARVFVKKAYVQGRFADAAVLRVGAASLPWVPASEQAQGYRYVEKALVDRVRFGTSTDWGVHLAGTLAADRVDYAVAAINGRGYRDPTRSGSVDVEARLRWHLRPDLSLAVGGYSGPRGNAGGDAEVWHVARRANVMLAWQRDGWRVGGEAFRARNWHQVLAPAGDEASGWSLWASGPVGGPASWFVRLDAVRTSRILDPRARDDYLHAGVAWRITRGLDLAVAGKQRARPGAGGTRRVTEVGVWAQVAF